LGARGDYCHDRLLGTVSLCGAQGLAQAFIIALYAEMYGFPLTIYLWTGFFRIDLPLYAHTGHLWASLLGYGAGGAMIEMLIGGVFIVSGVVLLITGWRSVYQASRVGRFTQEGVYIK
jgi:hypothetical protein